MQRPSRTRPYVDAGDGVAEEPERPDGVVADDETARARAGGDLRGDRAGRRIDAGDRSARVRSCPYGAAGDGRRVEESLAAPGWNSTVVFAPTEPAASTRASCPAPVSGTQAAPASTAGTPAPAPTSTGAPAFSVGYGTVTATFTVTTRLTPRFPTARTRSVCFPGASFWE